MTVATDNLVCPHCRKGLNLESNGSQSTFRCRCGKSYAIVDGVIRFVVSEAYTESFGFQWNLYDVQRIKDDVKIFEDKTSIPPNKLKGLRVLDAGCGGGRYSYVVGQAGAQVDGIDLSTSVNKAQNLTSLMPNVRISQGDIFNLPYPENTFDFAYSIGVVDHTPEPRGAFSSIAKTVRPGGRLALWIYRKNTWPQECVNKAIRALTTRLPLKALKLFSLIVGGGLGGIPILNKTLARLVNFGSSVPDWRLRSCDCFDWYSPQYQYHFTPQEVRQWFEEEDFTNIVFLRPQKKGRFYNWAYDHNFINGSGVNFIGTKKGEL